jgi:cytochrome c
MRRTPTIVAIALMLLGFRPGEPALQPGQGNPNRGAAVFAQCMACHSIEPGVHLSGPSLARIWGRRAGIVDGFTRYSEPLARATIVWDERTLDRWLEQPQAVIPGNL